ncbi:MAG: hypothetical protein DI587_35595 [Variovorax paradoxus]|nr:MAG: hypothetical protein DI583_35595 [Variovorax paradoxus]PZQ01174.1 MAG: hypothetical protein DI587_35595 [Variovorax paradoxus]
MSRIRFALIATFVLVGAVSQAQAANDKPLTREQVRAEYLQARAEGRLPPTGELGYVPPVSSGTSSLTRAEVHASFLRARAEGLLPATGEVGDVFQVGPNTSTLTRAEVLRDLAVNGPMPTGEGADLGASRVMRR